MIRNLSSFAFFLFIVLAGYAAEIVVCENCEINSLSEGIARAEPNDVIIVKAGIYRENNLVLDKPLKLVGKGRPIIDGHFGGDVFVINADSVQIKGFKIVNVGKSFTEDNSAIRVQKSKSFLIEDNDFERIFFGITLEKSSNGSVVNNRLSGDALEEFNSGNGIHLWYCKNVLIKNNVVNGLRDGIYFEFVDDSEITGNVSKGNLRYGLHFMFSNNDIYTNNIFENNGAGVAVMFSKKISMKHNLFKHNWGTASYGLLLKEIYDAEITDNVFEKNSIAINAEGSNRINYLNNEFINNGWAIKIRGACFENKFHKNDFQSNTFDISYKGMINDNEFNGNYWSSYTGYDLDKDGIGDVPFRPVKLFSYIVNRTPETIVLLRSLFVDLINFSEKVSPVFTPDNLVDLQPLMKEVK